MNIFIPILDASILVPLWLYYGVAAVVGACVGSFLNVVIYRVPAHLSINQPARSFCPSCKHPIAWHHNLPIISWLVLRGKCANCRATIAFRYWLVEVLTAGLFTLAAFFVWQQSLFVPPSMATPTELATPISFLPLLAVLPLWVWLATAIVISFIDAEHMLVFPRHTVVGMLMGMAYATLFYPESVGAEPDAPWFIALLWSAMGAAVGAGIVLVIARVGKLLLGKWSCGNTTPTPWSITEPESADPQAELTLSLGTPPDEKRILWGDLFRGANSIVSLRQAELTIDGTHITAPTAQITASKIVAGEQSFDIEDISTAHGTAMHITGTQEVMGSGDVWIMLMVGAICGVESFIFIFLVASLIGLAWGGIARIRSRQPLPFGPALLLAATLWLTYGKALWAAYLTL